MNKKQIVKTLLEITLKIPKESIPHKSDGSMDIEKFYEVPLVSAVITILKHFMIDSDYLSENGFIPASMVFGSVLKVDKEDDKDNGQMKMDLKYNKD